MRIDDITYRLPQHPVKSYGRRSIRKIEQIAVHHTASMVQDPYQYAAYHVDGRDWPGIGYHFMIRNDGHIYQTNRLDTISYNVARQNTKTIGVCLMGDFTDIEPTPPQLQAAAHLIALLKVLLQVEKVEPHSAFKDTSCPGACFPWSRLLKMITKMEYHEQD